MGISGRIQTRSYDAKDGTKRYITEVVADEVQFLEWGNGNKSDSRSNNYESGNYGKAQGSYNNNYGEEITPIDEEGEIPF